ncbi:MAG: PA14 domain-containing protein, partial [Candidatus Rokuibacteriota bacterium]
RGDSGRDDFVAELLEVRDLDEPAGEKRTAPDDSERSTIPPEGPPVDAAISIVDPALRVAIAEALGIPVTQSYRLDAAGNPIPLIHADDGFLPTHKPLSMGDNFRERILASDLAEIMMLDAAGLGIRNLTGLEFAINAQTLNLAGNQIADGELGKLTPATVSSGDARGFPVGLAQLENLLLDFNLLTDLSALEELNALDRLSFDGAQSGARLAQIPQLSWPTPFGVERGLDFLSLDNTRGLTGFYFALSGDLALNPVDSVAEAFVRASSLVTVRVDPNVDFDSTAGAFDGSGLEDGFLVIWQGKIYLEDTGPVTFFIESDDGSRLFVDGLERIATNDGRHGMQERASAPLNLARGFHDIELRYFESTGGAGVKLRYDPVHGPKQIVPQDVLFPSTALADLSAFAGLNEDGQIAQNDLRILSLKDNLIEDIRPLFNLEALEILRLEGNLVADIQELAGQRLVDDGDPEFTPVSRWFTNLYPVSGAFEGDYHFTDGVGEGSSASWAFEELAPGNYEVLVTWTESGSRPDAVTYEVGGSD